jgi:polyisoprenoid-binding protein YceI
MVTALYELVLKRRSRTIQENFSQAWCAGGIVRSPFLPSLLALLLVAIPRLVSAQDVVVALDPSQSAVDFTLGAFLHTVHGSFQLKSGEIAWDTETGKAQGVVDVDLTTGATGIRARDDIMRGRVLESQHYADATFTADSVAGRLNPSGVSTLDIHGQLAIHGLVHETTFHTTIAANGARLAVSAHTMIPYAAWGMTNPSTFLLHVEDHVEVNVRSVAALRSETP